MKTATSLLFASCTALFVAACSTQPATPPATPDSIHYRCESGATISASYPDTDTARVTYQGRTHALRIAVSASGARYVGDGIEWWTKGSGPGSQGSLLRHLPDGTSGDLLQLCSAS